MRRLREAEAEIGVMQPQAKDTWSPQKLEEIRRDPPLESSEGAQPYCYLDFRLPASRTGIG